MATAGNLIKQSNFSTSWAMEYGPLNHSSKDSVHYLFICAPCWYVVINAGHGIFGGSGIVQFRADYYNGSKWVSDAVNMELSGAGGASQTRIGHNRDENNRGGFCDNEYPLWRIRYWSSRNNDNWNISFYAGGYGMAVDANGNSMYYPQGKLIYSRGRTGKDTMMHDSGTTDDTTNVVNNIFNPSKRRGSLIYGTDDSELIWAPYLKPTT